MNSKILSSIKNKLKICLKDREILDIVVFGSAVKGKTLPEDIDIAVITKKQTKVDIKGFHVSILIPEDFFVNPPSIVHTLLREGYSLKNEKPFSEIYKFSNKVLFKYELTNLSPSKKVKIVNILRGKKGENGLVKENFGEWLANQVFIVPVGSEHIFSQIFVNFGVKFNKFYILIH
ncbi:MAG: nucleotidyltransferase domain-containing protein [Nanoarchaeota archaeon]|nr:nucleotidyltransferase domain-containing protein [Nanoarchaeota archaeon]